VDVAKSFASHFQSTSPKRLSVPPNDTVAAGRGPPQWLEIARNRQAGRSLERRHGTYDPLVREDRNPSKAPLLGTSEKEAVPLPEPHRALE
jgi:hypothetical protein